MVQFEACLALPQHHPHHLRVHHGQYRGDWAVFCELLHGRDYDLRYRGVAPDPE